MFLFTGFLERNAICRLTGTLLPTPTLPAGGKGANSGVPSQAAWGFHGVLNLSMAFMMVRSLRMQAVMTTLAGLSAVLRRRAKALMSGLGLRQDGLTT